MDREVDEKITRIKNRHVQNLKRENELLWRNQTRKILKRKQHTEISRNIERVRYVLKWVLCVFKTLTNSRDAKTKKQVLQISDMKASVVIDSFNFFFDKIKEFG
jgi:hypothetical protein